MGQTCEVLVEGPSPHARKRSGKDETTPAAKSSQLVGRTRGDHIVVFDGAKTLIGKYVDVEITDAGPLTLFGKTRRPTRLGRNIKS